MDKNFTIACFLPRPFKTYSHSPHVKAMAQFARVLIVEESVNLHTIVKDWRRVMEWFNEAAQLRQLESNMYLYTPAAIFPIGFTNTYPWFRYLNRSIMFGPLERILKEMNLKLDAAIIFMPQQEAIIDWISARLLCYVLYDNWPAYAEYSFSKQCRMRKSEERIFNKAGLILASSRYLQQLSIDRHHCVAFVPNAAEYHHFSKARLEETPIAPDIKQLKRPLIGFIGSIEQMVDLGTIIKLALTHPEWSLVMVGPVTGNRRFIRSKEYNTARVMPNVHFLGRRDYESLPCYLKGFDVCLLPYKDTEWTHAVYPNKLHQYLAAGKPVVSIGLQEVEFYKDVVYLADNYAQFERCVARALLEDTPQRQQLLMSVAQRHSTEVWGRQVLDAIQKTLDCNCV